jgi:Tannase and feruloyl esterase
MSSTATRNLLNRFVFTSALSALAIIGSAAALAETTGLRDLPAVAPVTSCAALQSVTLDGVTDQPAHIRRATEVKQGEAHPYCKIEGVVEPAVEFEVHLPLSSWTQRYLQIGCGGLCGMLNVRLDDHTNGCRPADNGELALASTDMGHEGGMDGSWAAGNPQARVDFAYRGVHVTAQVAKALIAKFYGQPPRFSYFSGCSDGGREALMEAQRYPQEFNGIAAGAPALNFSVQNSFYHAWNALSNTDANGRAILTAARLPILHAGALAACDAADGLKDGLIEDPRRCQFDPATVQCKAGEDSAHCLTAAEVEVARRIYAGAHDADGRKLVIGGPMPGSELAWGGVYIPMEPGQPIFSALIATGSIQNLYYPEPLHQGWTLQELKFDQATLDSFKFRSIYDATNPDLRRFNQAGGRLLMWHGWSDPHISPLNSIAYYSAMQELLGKPQVGEFARLFLFPGLYHCGGGDGFFQFDVLTPLMAWVEGGQAPERILASHNTTPQRMGPPGGPPPTPGVVDRTRPVFAFPKVARYSGQGSVDDPANFTAADPQGPALPPVNWLGSKYMVPGLQQVCASDGKDFTCKAAP